MLEIKDGDQSVFVKGLNKKYTIKEKFRDIKTMLSDEFMRLIVGIENQNDLSNVMPSRIMLYDAIEYENQISELRKKHYKNKDLDKSDYLSGISKKDKLIPIVTVVFYYGEDPWDRAEELMDMLDMDSISEEVKPLIQNYRINLIDIHNINDFSKFKTSLGPLLELMKIRKDKKALKNYTVKYENFLETSSDELFDIIATLLNAKWLIAKKHELSGKGVNYNMCTGMRDWLEEVRAEGEAAGEARGEARGELRGKLIGIDIACQILADIHNAAPISAIASKYEIDENKVLMIIQAMSPGKS